MFWSPKSPNAHLGDHEGLDLAGVRDVRAHTQVDHRSTAVHRRRRAVRDFGLDEVFLVFVVLLKVLQ